jgi:DNA-binding LacI/PurR family transcriptional regulator
MKKTLSILDVAKHAGVSPATVSRALSGQPIVSATTLARVHAAVAELGFHPNQMAQGLRRGRGSSVALLVGDIEQGVNATLTKHIQAALEGIGLDLVLYNLGHKQERLEGLIERAEAMRLYGIVVATTDVLHTRRIKASLAAAAAQGLPVFAIGHSFKALGVPSVAFDDFAAIRRSVGYLIERYGPRVAYLGRIKGSTSGMQRYQGYLAALKDHAVKLDEALVWDRAYRYPAGHQGTADALDQGLRFRAIQTGSDELALGAISALRQRHLNIPEDVAVAGIGDMDWSAHLTPALTTHGGEAEQIASVVQDMFVKHRNEDRIPQVVNLERAFHRRQSA